MYLFQDDDGKAKVKLPLFPVRADHSAYMDSDDNNIPLSPTTSQPPQDSCVQLHHDSFFFSPQCSGDYHHSGIFQVFNRWEYCTCVYTCIAVVLRSSKSCFSLQAIVCVGRLGVQCSPPFIVTI